MAKVRNLTGQRFGNLEVLEFVGVINHRAVFKCKCDCGNIKTVQGQLLLNGHTKSCGCISKEKPNARKHGLTNTKIYGVWCGIKCRCLNEKSHEYQYYGGRGITICQEWQNDFQAFYDWAMANGYQEGLTIDRKDVNGNYEPSNCCWVTMEFQNNNRRNCVKITYNGETKSLSEFAKQKGIKYTTLWRRLNVLHWSVEKALSTP